MPSGIYQHKPLSEEHKRRIGEVQTGRKLSEKQREQMSKRMMGNTLGFKKGQVSFNKGKHPSQETLKKLRESHKGQIAWNKGKKLPPHTEEWKKKVSEKLKGRKLTEEHKQKLSLSHIGIKHSEESKIKESQRVKEGYKNGTIKSYWLGKHPSKETIEKNRIAHLGKKASDETRRKLSLAMSKRKEKYGYINSPETRKKVSDKQKGKIISKEAREKISKGHKGKKLSKEHKNKISERLKEDYKLGTRKIIPNFKHNIPHSETTKEKLRKYTGDKTSGWQGGISFEPYSVDWTKTLKQAIRQRDKYTCQICGKEGIIVHHIDYNKKNCISDNLITLCNSCHTATNTNRPKWINYFKKRGELCS
jgi:hypothetical protein